MSTPEPPKNYITKGISKTLLTPCRRIGLSRTKKTPKSVDSPLIKPESTSSTSSPVLHTPKIKLEYSEQKPTKQEEYKTPELHVSNKSFVAKQARKCEANKLESPSVTPAVQTPNQQDSKPKSPTCFPECSPFVTKISVQVHHPPAKRTINFDKKEDTQTANSQILKLVDSNTSNSPPVAKRKKTKLYIKSDESDTYNSKSQKALTTFTTEEFLDEFSKDSETFGFFKNLEHKSDAIKSLIMDEPINTKINRKEKNYIAISYPISSSHSGNPLTKRKLTVNLEQIEPQSLQLKKVNSSNSKPKLSLSKLTFDNEDSDDEMFTSSPGNDKKQRDNLLELIGNMEKEVKRKRETMEKLKQAQIYKKIHSPQKLKDTADVWLNGCKRSLQDLLLKMQDLQLGPMDLNTLIQKLGIPDSVREKLSNTEC